MIENDLTLVAAAEIRDRETGLVSGLFSWFQSRQIFHETHEIEEPYIFIFYQLSKFSKYVNFKKKHTFEKG